MQALYWDGTTAKVTERPEPELPDDYALLEVRRVGVCNTDLEIVRGYMDFRGVLGHEVVGEVLRGPSDWKGKTAVVEINFACGRCESCAQGLGRHCPHRSVMGILGADGGMAQRVAVPVRNLHEVPASLDLDVAVFSEPLAAAFEILEQVHVVPGMRCVVLGDGKLGLLVAQVLYTTGAEVLCVGKHETKLAHLERHGITTVTKDAWSVGQADLVVEATGSKEGFQAAIAATRPRGTLVLKSTVADQTELHLAPLTIHEIRVLGSRCGSFAPALRALRAGSIDVSPLISEKLPLAKADVALERAAAPGALKVLLAND